MRAWTAAELGRFASSSSLRLAAGRTPPDSVEVGMVTVGADLYVRAAGGVGSRWFRAAVDSGEGWIDVDGHRVEVLFAHATGDDGGIEAAYRQRYGAAAAFATTSAARAATLRVVARSDTDRPEESVARTAGTN